MNRTRVAGKTLARCFGACEFANMSALELVADYRNDPELKQAFFEFTPQALYGASFVEWDRLGFWNENYIPYSLVERQGAGETKMVANVSVSRMRVLIQGREIPAVQFATVGTLPEYRGRGLAARLMRHALDREACDFSLLFANASVSEFYPKFGFHQAREALFYSAFDPAGEKLKARRLDLQPSETTGDLALFKSLLARRAPITRRFGALNYEHILPFYAVYAFGDDLYYFESEQPDDCVLIVAQNEGAVLNVYDVVSPTTEPSSIQIQRMLREIAAPETREVCYHFTPELVDSAARPRSFDDSDSPLFIRGDFPEAALDAFKFPALAQT